MSLKTRIIPCFDVKDARTARSNFVVRTGKQGCTARSNFVARTGKQKIGHTVEVFLL